LARRLVLLPLLTVVLCSCTDYASLQNGEGERQSVPDGGGYDAADPGTDRAEDGGSGDHADHAGSDVGPCGPEICQRDSQCPWGKVCVAGRCGAVRWEAEVDCTVAGSGCTSGSFPDQCYTNGVFIHCPTRGEPIAEPACVSFLELGAPGEVDDQKVARLLYDLWKQGQQDTHPPRARVVMAVGDSISATHRFINARAFECELPDFPFDGGYRLVGQPETWDTVITATGSTTAEWGRRLLASGDWYQGIRPEMATVMFGTNELWNGTEGLGTYVTNMRAIVDRLLEHRVIPVLVTLPPGTYPIFSSREICGEWCADLAVNYRTDDFAQAVRDLAAERLVPLVDLHRRFTEFDKGSWDSLLSDGVHPCHWDCPPGTEITGCELHDDAVLRMIKFLEARVLDRCPGSGPPPRPPGYQWDGNDILSNFRGAAAKSYCPDPVATCR
jgi:lysophospholipase L1-like esterase